LDAVDAALIVTDLDYKITYWSKGAERLYGWTADEVIGTKSTALFRTLPGDDSLQRYRRGALHTHASGELTVARKDGSPVTVSARATPIYEDGQQIGVLSMVIDIGERKKTEESLREAQDFLTTVTDNVADGMFALDETGRAMYVNAAAGRLLGWEPKELLGRDMHATAHFERRDGSPFPVKECPMLRPLETGAVAHIDHDVLIRKDGSSFPVAYSSSPLVSGGARGCVVVFQDMTEHFAEQLRVERELEKLAWVGRIQDAFDEDRFVLYAQPILDLRSNEVVQHELLIRMLRPDGEAVSPGLFLPTAEEYGLIGRIDRWVISEAARIAGAGHHVEFNLSAKSIGDPNMVRTIRGALRDSGADPEDLVCEITETALMHDQEAGERFVRSLCDMGCKIALDDFGTGYGGFSYLKRLPVSYLKIDVQFIVDVVEELASQHVVRAVVSLAQAFGLETVAEGTESPASIELLKDLGVDYAQGYAIARPAPVAEVLAIQTGSRRTD
jgi:PAS domain S-box-containing protein